MPSRSCVNVSIFARKPSPKTGGLFLRKANSVPRWPLKVSMMRPKSCSSGDILDWPVLSQHTSEPQKGRTLRCARLVQFYESCGNPGKAAECGARDQAGNATLGIDADTSVGGPFDLNRG